MLGLDASKVTYQYLGNSGNPAALFQGIHKLFEVEHDASSLIIMNMGKLLANKPCLPNLLLVLDFSGHVVLCYIFSLMSYNMFTPAPPLVATGLHFIQDFPWPQGKALLHDLVKKAIDLWESREAGKRPLLIWREGTPMQYASRNGVDCTASLPLSHTLSRYWSTDALFVCLSVDLSVSLSLCLSVDVLCMVSHFLSMN